MTGQTPSHYTARQAAYDLKILRGKGLISKVGTTRRYTVQPHPMRSIAALMPLRSRTAHASSSRPGTLGPGAHAV